MSCNQSEFIEMKSKFGVQLRLSKLVYLLSTLARAIQSSQHECNGYLFSLTGSVFRVQVTKCYSGNRMLIRMPLIIRCEDTFDCYNIHQISSIIGTCLTLHCHPSIIIIHQNLQPDKSHTHTQPKPFQQTFSSSSSFHNQTERIQCDVAACQSLVARRVHFDEV